MNILCDGTRVQLTKRRRADSRLFDLCANVASIDIADFTATEPTYLNLAYTHDTRIRVNNDCMNRFIAEHNPSTVYIPKNKNNPKTQDVRLAEGMPVIVHTTNKRMNILNSQTFNIIDINHKNITLSDGVGRLEINTADFHKYFYLGFCITVHASQGATYFEKYTIHDWIHPWFCERAMYVAMSRSTDIANIQIKK
jgi:ATP-dependent exoDNAse (exonuclease V) alpha subunit